MHYKRLASWILHAAMRWIFVSSSVHKRKLSIMGDTSKLSVQQANCIAARTAMLLLLATVMEIPWCVTWLHLRCRSSAACVCTYIYVRRHGGTSEVEQPGSSVLRRFPLMKHVIRACRRLRTRCFFKRFFLGAYGHFSCKPTWLLGYIGAFLWFAIACSIT